ncbi:hypothetical protein ES708_10738 [subsurface metagenome]
MLQGADVTKKFLINQRQIEEIIDTLDEILNYYSHAYDSSTWVKGLPLQHGIQYTLDAIRFKLQNESSNPAHRPPPQSPPQPSVKEEGGGGTIRLPQFLHPKKASGNLRSTIK